MAAISLPSHQIDNPLVAHHLRNRQRNPFEQGSPLPLEKQRWITEEIAKRLMEDVFAFDTTKMLEVDAKEKYMVTYQWGKYKIYAGSLQDIEDTQPIGHGLTSYVYKVQDQTDGQYRVLKIAKVENPKIFAKHGNVFTRYLQNEHKLLAEMPMHLNIQPRWAVHVIEGRLALSMLHSKISLLDLVLADKLSADDMLFFAKDILIGLIHVHKNGIWHGDIKLKNFLIFKNDLNRDILALSDFGGSKRMQDLKAGDPPTFTTQMIHFKMRAALFQLKADEKEKFPKFAALWDLQMAATTIFMLFTKCTYPLEHNPEQYLVGEPEDFDLKPLKDRCKVLKISSLSDVLGKAIKSAFFGEINAQGFLRTLQSIST